MLLSFAAAPFLLGFLLYAIDALLRRSRSLRMAKVREAGFAVLRVLGVLGLVIGLIREDDLERPWSV